MQDTVVDCKDEVARADVSQGEYVPSSRVGGAVTESRTAFYMVGTRTQIATQVTAERGVDSSGTAGERPRSRGSIPSRTAEEEVARGVRFYPGQPAARCDQANTAPLDVAVVTRRW